MISIHAPARGATEMGYKVPKILVFQSTLPRGERPGFLVLTESKYLFQSTLPRGERRNTGFSLKRWTCHFNPRSREGSDGRLQSIRTR